MAALRPNIQSQAFLQCLQQGEGLLDLSAAALHIAAEDDALGALCCAASLGLV